MIRVFHILLLCLLLPLCMPAQNPWQVPVKEYPFVRLEENRILYPGDSQALHGVFEAWNRILLQGTGQSHVVHMGGSHVQADVFSDRIRQRLQQFYPGTRGARGMVFPFKAAGTNQPANYSISVTGSWTACRNVQRERSCELGITGISLTTWDTLARLAYTQKGDGLPYDFNRVRVFHDTGPDAMTVWLANAVTHTRTAYPEQGYTEFLLTDYVQDITLEFRRTDSLHRHTTLHGVSLENTDPGIYYHAAGINGASVPSWNRCSLLERHLTLIDPNLVILAIGINDANGTSFDAAGFERNYDQLVARIRNANPEASILFIVNNDCYYKKRYPNKNTAQVREAMLRLAVRHHAAVWDLYTLMGGLGSSRRWELGGLMQKDKIHFTPAGYQYIGDLLYNALVDAYLDYIRHYPPRMN